MRLQSKHWYAKVQSALFLASLDLPNRSLESLRKIYENERNVEVKRSLIKCLYQLQKDKLDKFLRNLIFENDKKLYFPGRMLYSILHNQNNAAFDEISNIFRRFNEEVILEEYYKIEVIKYCSNQNVRKNLLKKLKSVRKAIKREHLQKKVEKTIEFLIKGVSST